MTFGKKIKRGMFVLYREKSATGSVLTPARAQSDMGAVIALSDVTGIQPGNPPRIICGPAKWMDVSRLRLWIIDEADLLAAPTVEGVKK